MRAILCCMFGGLAAGSAWGQVALLPGHAGNPRLTHGNASAQQGPGGVTVFLQSNSRIAWKDFSVPSGSTLRFQSQGAPGRSSVNVVDGLSRSFIRGQVVADGAFALLNARGITVAAGGSISAPRILLSGLTADNDLALLNGGSTRWTNAGGQGRIQIDGSVDANSGALVVMGPTVTVGNQGRVRSSGGVVQMMAADRAEVNGPDGTGKMAMMSGSGSGLFSSQGAVEAREVEIIADGFLRNGGRIVSSGAGNKIRLAAPAILHENRPQSLIQGSQFITDGTFDQQGRVVNPDDGSNPSGVSGIRQLPKLTSASPDTLSDLRPAQLSHSPLQAVMLGTPVNGEPEGSRALAVRRGAVVAERTAENHRSAGPEPARKKKVLKSHKASFFQQMLVGR